MTLVFLFSIYLFVYYSLFCFILRCMCGYNILGGACLFVLLCFYAQLSFSWIGVLGFLSPYNGYLGYLKKGTQKDVRWYI